MGNKLINRVWNKCMHFMKNKGLDIFLSDNKLLICFVGIYFCFEELFDSLCNVYLSLILKYFNVSVMSKIVFALLFVWIAYNGCIKYKRRVLVSNKSIGFSIFILYLWTKYRLCTDSAYSLYIYSFSYVDIILLLLVGGYIALRLFRCAPKKSGSSSDGFFIDEPITCSKDDLLNRKIDAYVAAEKLLSTKTENNAFTFGIVAPWGNGKTSFLYMMKEHIDAKNADDVVTISFHPWKYGKSSNLTYLFFEELSKALAPYSTIFSRDIIRYARTVSSIENSTMKFLWSILGCLVPQTVEEQYEDLKKKISNIQRKIVVFIDDIDRLGANEIEELFRLVRNTSNLPSMYFVMAYDKKYVVDTLNSIFPSHSLSYSQKILQEEFFLPVIKNNELKAVLREKLSVFLNSEEMEQVDKLLNRELFNSIDVFSYIRTLRDIKRLANALRLHLRKLHGEIDICDYIILEILRQQYPFVLELIVYRKDDILLLNNSGKYVYFNGENGPEEKENILAKMYPFKGFNILEYIEANSEVLSVPKAKIDSLKKLLDALWGEYRTYSSKGINVPEYTQRYLYSSILDSEVSDVEFDKIWLSPFDEMKSTLKEWMENKSYSLVDKVEKRKVANKADTYKQLHMLFYIGSIGHKYVPEFRVIVERIKMLKEMNGESHDYLAEDKEEFLNCLYENGINSFMLKFLCKLFYNGSFEEDFILSEDEVIKIQQDLFLQYIKVYHPMNDVLDCWLDTSHDVWIADSNGDRHPEKMEHTEVSRKAMKDYAINHITEFVENTISCSLPNTSRKYRINGIVLQIWESWDEYEKNVNRLDVKTAKLQEYKDFLKKIKEFGFKKSVSFNFKELHIEQ